MSNLLINHQAFVSFLKLIQPNSETFVFQTFTDDKLLTKQYRKDKRYDPLACTFSATPEEAIARLQPLQSKGAGIFVQVNVGVGRGKGGITALSTYFLDTDGAPLSPIVELLPKPLGVTVTSTGRHHVFWRTKDALAKYKPTQKALAIAFKCDEAMVNLDRVVRIPGTWHTKDPSNPVQVRFQAGVDTIYTAEQLLACLPRATPDMASALITGGCGFELPETLPAGGRTHHLISYAGQLAAQGYGEQYIRDEVKKVMLDRCPPGDAAIPDETLEIEIYPAVKKFTASASCDTHTPVLGVPQVPAPPVQEHVQDPEWGSSDPEAITTRATRDARELQTVEQFIAQLIYVENNRRVVHVRPDDTWKVLGLDEFKVSYGNIKRNNKPLVKLWLESPARATVRDVMYHPSEDRMYEQRGELMVNNYEGNDLIDVKQAHPAQIQVFLDHMQYIFPRQEDAKLFLNWMAATIQRPAVRIPWMPLLISQHGVGKGWIFSLLQELLGFNNCSVVVPEGLDSDFNEYLFETTLLLMDELKTPGKNQFEFCETLKPIITNPYVTVNIKFGAKGTYPIYCNTLGFTNHYNAVAIPDNDRRFWVCQITAAHRDPAYYDTLFQWLNTDGPAHVFRWLANLDLSKWNDQAPPPMTEAKKRMVDSFKSEIERVLDDAIKDHAGPFVADVVTLDILQDYVERVLKKDRLDRSDLLQVKNYVQNKCHAPHDEENRRFHMTYITQGEAMRYVHVVRGFEKWCSESQENLCSETERAWKASLGEEPGANLSLVTKP